MHRVADTIYVSLLTGTAIVLVFGFLGYHLLAGILLILNQTVPTLDDATSKQASAGVCLIVIVGIVVSAAVRELTKGESGG